MAANNVGVRGKVPYQLVPFQRSGQRLLVGGVCVHELKSLRREMRSDELPSSIGQIVVNRDFVTGTQQQLNYVAADESSTAGQKDPTNARSQAN